LQHVEEDKRFLCKEAEDIAKTYLNQDVYDNPIRVAPSAHYLIGGIKVNAAGQVINKQNQSITGLYAIGECASAGVHGANRLGGNSLMETLVFGRNIAQVISTMDDTRVDNRSSSRSNWSKKFDSLMKVEGDQSLAKILQDLKHGMSDKVGVLRTEQQLQDQMTSFPKLKERLQQVSIKDKSLLYNKELVEYIELAHMITVAEAVTLAALHRVESRGAHYRLDFPTQQDKPCNSQSFLENQKLVSIQACNKNRVESL
jgi:succinate dehydrogenase / fumarate reductase flavoprotein subunit